jgi:hypothetical protein
MEITTKDGGTALLMDESYNANPASMRSTLAVLGAEKAKRRIAVLGAMKELGDFGPALHAQLLAPIAEAKVDFALLVGPEMAALAEELGTSGQAALGKPIPSPIARPPMRRLPVWPPSGWPMAMPCWSRDPIRRSGQAGFQLARAFCLTDDTERPCSISSPSGSILRALPIWCVTRHSAPAPH